MLLIQHLVTKALEVLPDATNQPLLLTDLTAKRLCNISYTSTLFPTLRLTFYSSLLSWLLLFTLDASYRISEVDTFYDTPCTLAYTRILKGFTNTSMRTVPPNLCVFVPYATIFMLRRLSRLVHLCTQAFATSTDFSDSHCCCRGRESNPLRWLSSDRHLASTKPYSLVPYCIATMQYVRLRFDLHSDEWFLA